MSGKILVSRVGGEIFVAAMWSGCLWLGVSEAEWVCLQGLGNMAVSNAFGSNTFNIFVALVRLLLILKLILWIDF